MCAVGGIGSFWSLRLSPGLPDHGAKGFLKACQLCGAAGHTAVGVLGLMSAFLCCSTALLGLICPGLCAVSGSTRKDGSSFADLGTSTLPLAMPLRCCREASGDGGTQVILWKSLEQGLAHENLVKVAVLFPLSCAMVYLLWEPGGGLRLFMKFLSLNQPGALIKPVLWRTCSWVLSILSEFCVANWDVLPLT